MNKQLHLFGTLALFLLANVYLWGQCTNPSIGLPDVSTPVNGNPATAYCVTIKFDPATTGYPTGLSMLLQHTYQGDLDIFINACGNTLNVMQRPGAVGNCAGGSPFGNGGDIGSPGSPVNVTFSNGGGPDPENGIAVGGGNYGVTTDDACGVGTPGITSFAALWAGCPPGEISAQVCIGDHAFGDSGVAQDISLVFPMPIVCGCTNPASPNYNPAATVDDGSCAVCSITVSGAPTQPSCNLNNGAISITPSGAGFTYDWSPASLSGSNPTNLAPGTYSVTVTQTATGCVGATSVTLNPSTPLVVNAAASQPTCGLTNGSISVTPSGAGYTYTWSPATVSGSNPMNLGPGSYSVTVTQTSNGCTGVASVTLNPSTAVVATATPTQPTCSQNNGSISVSPSGAGYTYTWSPASLSGSNPTNLGPGTYAVTVTQTSTGCMDNTSVTLNPSTTITPTATPTQPTCGLNNGSISVSPSGAGYTYVWNPASLSGSNPTDLGPGSYSVTVTETASGCMANTSITLNPGTSITATATATQPTCALDNGSISVSPAGGGYTYAWSPASVSGTNPTNLAPGTYTVTVTETATGCMDDVSVTLDPSSVVVANLTASQPTCGQNNGSVSVTPSGPGYTYAWTPASITGSSASNLAPGTYSVTVTQTAGGCMDDASITLNPSPPPVANITANPPVICVGGSTQLTATGGGTYDWSTGQSGAMITVSPAATTTYSVTVSNNGCAAVGNFTVTVNTVTATATANPATACSGAPVQLTATGGGTYSWSTGQTGATVTVNPTATTTYSVTVTNNGCTDIANVTVTVNTVTATASANPAVACSGDPVQLTATGGGTYAWSTGQTGATITVNPVSTTTYSVTVTNNGCTDVANVTVTVNVVTATAVAAPAVGCAGDPFLLTATGGGTYSWNTGQSAASITVTPSATTTYTVTVTDNGCTDVENVTVTINTVTATAAGTPNPVCEGQSSVLTATGGGTYSWSTGQSGASITVSPPTTTTYTVTVTNNGCTATSSVTVVVNTVNASITADPNPICMGSSTVLTATGGSTYSWSTGQSGASITVSPAATTTYSVTATSNGCTDVENITVTVNSVTATATAAPAVVCEGGPAVLTATGGGTYAWSTGQTGDVITVNPLSTTTYSVTVSDNGCTDVANVTVTVTVVNGQATASPASICTGSNSVLTATGGGTYSWSTGQVGASITVAPTATTTYMVTVTNNGCTDVASVTVNVTTVTATATANPATVCVGQPVQLTATGGGTYQWSTGQTSATINAVIATATTFSVTVTNNGCTDVASVMVGVNTVTATATAAPAVVCEGATSVLTATGGGTYSWSTGQTGASISVSPTATTTYSVTVTNNGCTDVANVTVTVTTVTGQASASPAVICTGSNSVLTATGGGTYSWSTGQIGASITVAPIATTTYAVTVTNNGCTDVATVTVTVNTVTAGATANPSPVCAGQPVQLTATGGGTYSWSSGQTTANISLVLGMTTTFTVTVTNNGCSDVATVTANVNSVAASATASPSTICSGLSSVLTATGGGTYSWSTGESGASITVSPTATTTYFVTVTDGACTSVAPVTVSVTGVLTPSVTASPATVCPGQSTVLIATGGSTYVWSTGQSGSTITVNPAATTTYTVTATENGCTGTANVTVTVDPSLTATATASPGAVCAGQSTTLSATGGGAYAWSSGQSGASIMVTPTGTTTYTVTVTNNGCTGTADVTVNVTPLPTPTATATPATLCAGETTTLTATGGGTYLWNNSQIGSSITVAPTSTTTYTVTVTNDGCSAPADVTVTVNPLPTPAAMASPATVCAGESSNLSATGGGTYTWSSGQSGSPISVTPSGTTTYTVTVTNNGCSATANTTVTVTPLPVAAAMAGPATICVGQATTLTATGGGTYVWSTGQTGSSVTVSPASTTTYTVTVTHNGCTATADVTVTVNPLPTPTATASPAAVCAGQSTTLSATGGGTYAWSSGQIGSPITLIPTETTTYSVTVTNNGCSATADVTVTVNTTTASALAVPATICPGLTSILTATGGGTYTWSTGQSGASISVNPTATTTYSVTVTDNGCTDVATVTVNVENNLSATVDASPNILCAGQSATLSATGGSAYSWSNGQSGASISVTPAVTTTYTVTATDNGCTGTASVTVAVTPLPVPTAIASPAAICLGQFSTLTATGGSDYVWSDGQSGASIDVMPSQTTLYTVTVTNNGCTATTTATVTVTPSPAPVAVASPGVLCAGQSTTLSAFGGGAYLWSTGQAGASITVTPTATTTYSVTATDNGCAGSDDVTVTVNSTTATVSAAPTTVCPGLTSVLTATGGGTYAWSTGQSGAVISVTPLTTTTYTVTVTNNGCSDIKSVTVNVQNNLVATAMASPTTLCAGESTTLTATGGATYSWSNGLSGATVSVTPAATTTYSVTATNNGCTGTADVTVVVNPIPVPTASASQATICAGQTTTLTATGGGTYAWSSGQSGASISVTPSATTTYTVTVTSNSCTATATVLVTVNPLPTATATANPGVLCAGESTTLMATGGGTYLWSTGQTGGSIPVTPTATTTYVVTVTNNACSATASINVVVNPLPVPMAVASPGVICAGQTATLTANGGSTYLWNTGQTGASISVSPLDTTTYTVTASSNGCSATTDVTLFVNTTTATATADLSTICPGLSTNLTATGGGTYLWSTGETTAVIAVMPSVATTYSVTVTNNGCTDVASVTVSVSNVLAPTLEASPAVVCPGQSSQLTALGGDTYIWSTGQAGDTITVTPLVSTTYTVTVTNGNCTGTGNITVMVDATLITTAIASPDTICAGQSATLTASGGGTYLWSGGGTGASIVVMPSNTTTYSVTVSNNGCVGASNVTVAVRPVPVPVVGVSPGAICAGQSATLTASGGDTYSWSDGQVGASIMVTPAATTTYTVTATEAGCIGTGTATVVVNPLPSPIASASPGSICPGQAATLTASGGAAYLWSDGQSGSTITVNPTATTTYAVTATSNGCVGTATVNVTINTPPSPSATADPSTLCVGQSTTLTAIGGDTYQWSSGQLGPSIVVTPAVTTTYAVTATDSNGCQGTTTVTVTVNPLPVPAVGAMPALICAGDTTVLTASGGETYLWNTGANGATLSVFPTTTTLYSVTVTDLGCSASASTTVLVNPLPVALATPDTICIGESAILSANGGDIYQWSTGQTGSSVTVSPLATTTYTVTVIDEGCSAVIPVTVTVNPLPTPVIVANPPAICRGESSTLSVSGGTTFVWSTGQSGTSISVSPPATANYSVTATENGCIGTTQTTVLVSQPTFAVVTPAATICNGPGGPAILNFSSLVTAGDQSGSWVDVQNSGATGAFPSLDFTGVPAGSYLFRYTTQNASAPCPEVVYEVTVEVVFCNCPSVATLAGGPLCNAGGTLNLATLQQTAEPGVWSLVTTPAGNSPATLTNGVFNALNADAGLYELRFTLLESPPAGCPSFSTQSIAVEAALSAGIPEQALHLCSGANEVVALSNLLQGADAGGQWTEISAIPSTGTAFQAGAGTFAVLGQQAGAYRFQYTINTLGVCPSDEAVVVVVIEPLPIAQAGTDQALDCSLTEVTLNGSGSSSGANIVYQWSTTDGNIASGANTLSPVVDASGVYQLRVTNLVYGCAATDQVVVTANNTPPQGAIVQVKDPLCHNQLNGAISVASVTGGSPPYSYAINQQAFVMSPDFSNLGAGTYNLIIEDANGCRWATQVALNNPPAISVDAGPDVTIFYGDSTVLEAVTTPVDGDYSYTWTPTDSLTCNACNQPIARPEMTTTYQVLATDANGCQDSDAVRVTVRIRRDVYIPNGFSPNNDGVNDILMIYAGEGVERILEFDIYSRWGESVFYVSNFLPNDPLYGWNGFFRNQPAPLDVYVYYARVLYKDGKEKLLKGDILLAR